MNTQFIIPAGGVGHRLGFGVPKALVPLGGRSILARTLLCLCRWESPFPMIVIAPSRWEERFYEILRAETPRVHVLVVSGGEKRQDSVWHGLQALNPAAEIVAIHDAARPLVTEEAVRCVIETAAVHGAATLATPVSDTILSAAHDATLDYAPDRSRLWACQTPQVFRREILLAAYEYARARRLQFTDDATLAHHAGFPVRLVDGGPWNIKVTTAVDLELAELLLRKDAV